jgi:branched-chain amino acid transport system ATP-binding protein
VTLLDVSDVSKVFGGLRAVGGVSFQVAEGEIIGLIGPNGAGKTTLVDVLTGVQLPSSGRISYGGTDITQLSSHRRSRLGIARTFQIPRPFFDMTVRENVLVGAHFGRSGRHIRQAEAEHLADKALTSVGLAASSGHRTASLTTAGLKRLEVARCLAAEPKLLFLDEPLGGLNTSEVAEALDLIRALNRSGVTIVFIEHIVSAVLAVSHRIVVLANGRKLTEGAPQAMLADAQVRQAYLGNVEGAVGKFARRRTRSVGAAP